ncbi:MAG TPA: glycosyltransferase family 2 protein [Dehalococcoidia bacterium]|nr:glycosyltransferase family 2 protein [Dehalococcoidia bacterium]
MTEKIREGISFFFPAFNDAGTIGLLVEDGLRVLPLVTDDFEIIIINDGSFDDTGQVADGLAARHPQVRVIHHEVNMGYGAALKSGFAAATKELIFYTDGDRQFDVGELPKLLAEVEGTGIVSGYRVSRAEGSERRVSSALYNIVSTKLFGLGIRDLDCAFKVIRREVLHDLLLQMDGDFICAELFYHAHRRGFRVRQVPVHHYPRTYGVSMAYSATGIARSLLEFGVLVWQLRGRDPYLHARHALLRREFEVRRKVHQDRFDATPHKQPIKGATGTPPVLRETPDLADR